MVVVVEFRAQNVSSADCRAHHEKNCQCGFNLFFSFQSKLWSQFWLPLVGRGEDDAKRMLAGERDVVFTGGLLEATTTATIITTTVKSRHPIYRILVCKRSRRRSQRHAQILGFNEDRHGPRPIRLQRRDRSRVRKRHHRCLRARRVHGKRRRPRSSKSRRRALAIACLLALVVVSVVTIRRAAFRSSARAVIKRLQAAS